MKKFMLLTMVFSLFLLNSCVSTMNSAQKGALIGGGAGILASLVGGSHSKKTVMYGGGGALLGYIIGNEMDKNKPVQPIQQQQNQPQSYDQQREEAYRTSQYPVQNTNQRTKCHKVIVRTWKNGVMTETIEERCEGNKLEEGVY